MSVSNEKKNKTKQKRKQKVGGGEHFCATNASVNCTIYYHIFYRNLLNLYSYTYNIICPMCCDEI